VSPEPLFETAAVFTNRVSVAQLLFSATLSLIFRAAFLTFSVLVLLSFKFLSLLVVAMPI